jgi:nucleotide-binding universal stress UspA family protein
MLTQHCLILAPTDFSECSRHAALYAASIAKAYNGTVHLVHVIEPIEKTDQWSYVVSTVEQIKPLVEKEVASKLEQQATELKATGADVEHLALHGTGYARLAEYAEEKGVALIAIGTSGKRGLEHMILGSTTERLLRMAVCPVLSVPLPKH